ncbi:hypothetical protein HWB92_gp015 [Serratia phage vB_SmaA_3M]|uniref:Uncharacterized protein n=1 Tax=Serratia phage vB_SmaA_3M TaxID=2419930 RepID=A0A3G2YRZ7_9CAUD|nr:hypothetical protein HWB92_gp015 [Serratia phage vB_SmaA_3M]AYP28273.1 hypothetical protein 3M_015c [Serratia phage vB_SmaA_3M]
MESNDRIANSHRLRELVDLLENRLVSCGRLNYCSDVISRIRALTGDSDLYQELPAELTFHGNMTVGTKVIVDGEHAGTVTGVVGQGQYACLLIVTHPKE